MGDALQITVLPYLQGISMLMSGLAKLDATVNEELLDVASASLQAGLQEYGHQAVANTFYSLARLQHYNAELCAAVDKHVSQNMSDFTPQVRQSALDSPTRISARYPAATDLLHPCKERPRSDEVWAIHNVDRT